MKKVISYILAVMVLMNTAFAYTSTVTVKGIGLEVNSEVDEEIQIIPDLDRLSDWDGWEVKSGNTTVTNNKFTMPEGNVVIEGRFAGIYTLTIQMPNFIRTESKEEGESVTIQAITEKDGYEFTGWTATGITLTETELASDTITFMMPGNDVTFVANYSVAAIIANEDVLLGKYIKYEPNETEWTISTDDSGYTSAQTFNPSETISWRVLNNNNGQLEIISTRSVGNLYLQGETGYAKAVYTLNKLCEGYKNETYAISARNPGYVKGNRTEETADTTVVDEESSQPIIDTAEDAYPLTWANTYTNGINGFPYTDILYSVDINQMSTAGVLHSSDTIWLASRYLYTSSSGSGFGVHNLNSGGNVGSYGLCLAYSASPTGLLNVSYGVRPVISLNSRIKITGGEGTETSPYTISID